MQFSLLQEKPISIMASSTPTNNNQKEEPIKRLHSRLSPDESTEQQEKKPRGNQVCSDSNISVNDLMSMFENILAKHGLDKLEKKLEERMDRVDMRMQEIQKKVDYSYA